MVASTTAAQTPMSSEYTTGKDMLLLPDGSTYHLGAKKGDIHPRILTVGSQSRAATVASLLDKDFPVKMLSSSRQFHIYSGKYNGVEVSIIAIGMGAPMMDFMVREASFILPGELAIIRLGTGGLFNPKAMPGTVMTAGKGSMFVQVNYSHFTGCANDDKVDHTVSPPYLISNPVPCDAVLNASLISELKAAGCHTMDGLNSCGETFYSCQGRKDANFSDKNEWLLDFLMKKQVDFVEMETHQLFFLASIRKVKCSVAACAIGIVHRDESVKANVSTEMLLQMETMAGKACLEALCKAKLPQ